MTNYADTYGWDTVFATYFADANEAIARKKTSPTTFDVSENGGSWGNNKLSGKFGDWQLTTGGDGENVYMTLPISQATLNSNLFTCKATIEVQLQYLPQPTSDSGQIQDLKVKLTSDDPQNPIVSVMWLSDTVPSIPDSAQGTIIGLLQTWLNNNLQSFNHVFAAVNFEPVSGDNLSWLTPTTISYAVSDSPMGDVNTSIFAVLAMTESRPAVDSSGNPLGHQVSPYAIPKNALSKAANSGFLISNERFMEKMLLPGVELLFQNATADQFDISDDGNQITNLVPLQFQSITFDNNKTATPKIGVNDFNLTLEHTELVITFTNFNFQWDTGITVSINYSATATLSLNSSNNLRLIQSNCKTNGSISTSSAVTWEELGLAIGGAIVGACIGGFAYEAISSRSGGEVLPNTDFNAQIQQFQAEVETIPDQDGANQLLVNQVNDILQALSEVKAALNENAEPTTFKGFLSRNWAKVLANVMGAAIGASLGAIPAILQDIADDNVSDIPKLDSFASSATQSTTWSTATDYTLTSATLNGSLQLGGLLTYS